ncbi:MAG: DUF2157 domain-containing protein [Candidatus Auribacterota bacterium]
MHNSMIRRWIQKGLITPEQATLLQEELNQYRSDRSSRQIVSVLSTIGALLLGIASILFVAANWQALPDWTKILIFLGVTYISYFPGIYLCYEKASFPRTGLALIFLSCLTMGASLFLAAQIYHVQANHHILVLLWLAGIVPLMFLTASRAIACLCLWLFYIWMELFIVQIAETRTGAFPGQLIMSLHVFVSIGLFAFGSLLKRSTRLLSISPIIRFFSSLCAMGILFIFTFGDFFKAVSSEYKYAYTIPADIRAMIYTSIIIAGILLFASGLLPGKQKRTSVEEPLLLLILSAVTLFAVHPVDRFPYEYVFNAVFVITLLFSVINGYRNANMGWIAFGIFWLTVYLIARYCDMFWNLLPRSLFFAVGGILLLFWGIMLEHRRKQLRQQFGTKT